MNDEQTGEQLQSSKVPPQLQAHVWKKGQSGNPAGRLPGISMKEYIKLRFSKMNDEEREEFMEGIPKIELFKMAEGNPKQDTDLMSGGEKIYTLTKEERAVLDKLTNDK